MEQFQNIITQHKIVKTLNIPFSTVCNIKIAAWVKEHFQKSLSADAVHRAIHKCKWPCHVRKKPYEKMIQRGGSFLKSSSKSK